jgi:hypothetical protein
MMGVVGFLLSLSKHHQQIFKLIFLMIKQEMKLAELMALVQLCAGNMI